MKFRQFHDEKSSSFKSMKLAKGNQDSLALFRWRVRVEDWEDKDLLCGEHDAMNSSSSSPMAVARCILSSSSLISIKSR